jgi:hypothetical protein
MLVEAAIIGLLLRLPIKNNGNDEIQQVQPAAQEQIPGDAAFAAASLEAAVAAPPSIQKRMLATWDKETRTISIVHDPK